MTTGCDGASPTRDPAEADVCSTVPDALVLRSASRRIGVEHRANGAFLLGVDEQLGETRVRGVL